MSVPLGIAMLGLMWWLIGTTHPPEDKGDSLIALVGLTAIGVAGVWLCCGDFA